MIVQKWCQSLSERPAMVSRFIKELSRSVSCELPKLCCQANPFYIGILVLLRHKFQIVRIVSRSADTSLYIKRMLV